MGLMLRHGQAVAVAALTVGASLLAQLASADDPGRSVGRFDTVVIDAGHGGEDHGARSADGVIEKQVVLDVSLRLAERLRKHGLTVVLTRDSDAFVPLESRTSTANDARADLFVSIHANWSPSPGARGSETYFASGTSFSDESAREVAQRENEAFGGDGAPAAPNTDALQALFSDMIAAEDSEDSSAFARMARSELKGLAGASARDVKQAPFVVLMGVQMPASLIEVGFLSNPEDARLLGSARRREAMAGALERAVLSFGKRYDARRGLRDRSEVR